MVEIKMTRDAEKVYILNNLDLFPMVEKGAKIAGVTPQEYIDRFYEVFDNNPQKIMSAITKKAKKKSIQ